MLYAVLFSNDVSTTEVRWNRHVAECLSMTNVQNVWQYQAFVRISFWLTQAIYRGADKSLARPGRKEAAPVESVTGKGMGWFG